MFGLELLMAGAISLAPTPVAGSVECHAKKPVKINVIPSKSRVKYDFSKTKAALNNIDIDTISPYGPNHNTAVSGLMSGAIEVQNKVEFMHETYENLGLGCVYLTTVTVTLNIDPTVFIASEYPQGTCMHNAILLHERKHVREDQLIVNKYVNILGKAVESIVNSQKGAHGPYKTTRMVSVQTGLQNALNDMVRKYNDEMNMERQKRQQAIDNYEEYESIGGQCKQQNRQQRSR